MSEYPSPHRSHSPTPSDPQQGRAQDATAAAPVWIRHLSQADAEALDTVLAARNRQTPLGMAQRHDSERVERVQALLKLLDALPGAPEDADSQSAPESAPQGTRRSAMGSGHDRVRRTLEAVREAERRQQFMLAHNEMRPTLGGGIGWQRVGMVALAVILGMSLLLPVLDHSRAEANRIACASNLRVAGAGFYSYASDHQGVLPRGHVQPGTPWWHVGEVPSEHDPIVRSNSAHLYLLVRGGGYVDADDLACPTNPHAPRGEMTWQHYDWRSPEEVSYSYQNQYTEQPWHMDQYNQMAVLADKNPLFVARQGRVVFDAATPFNAPSRAHNRRGQNVLLLDGRVVWTARPTLNLNQPGQFYQTNIWVAEGIDRYTGTELPGSREDSFLVP